MSAEGTSLESIETGDIPNTADAGRMQAILRDMNESSEPSRHPQLQDHQSMPSRQPMPPTLEMSSSEPDGSRHRSRHKSRSSSDRDYERERERDRHQEEEQEEEEVPESREPKKNMWSTVFDYIREPLFVSVLFFLLSLPVFHTFVGKYAAWAFAVGGQLSWLGLGSLALLAGLIFAIFKVTMSFAGL
jgi:hypothetical protein